ncbi:MAG: OmpA family protein [Desulfuromonadaceae bacterium]|nr:OmpA family protein [Desulfuromonadaceae bacterium]
MMYPFSFIITLIALGGSALLSGCVAQATYEAEVVKTAQVEASLTSLERDYTLAIAQQEKLVAKNADLQTRLDATLQIQSELSREILRSRADVDRLEKVLSARGAETGAIMTELRQRIETLEKEKQELVRQSEVIQRTREHRLKELQATYDSLVTKMEEEITRGEITISELQGKLTLNLVERILFDSGQATLNTAGEKVIKRLGGVLKSIEDKVIIVEGHTDNVPISPRLKKMYADNWELSAARATNVVRFLQNEIGIDGNRLAASGYGQFRPLASNLTAEGRAQNRRIQIVFAPLELTTVNAE